MSQVDNKGGQRVFYGLLQKVGALGRYQYINLLILNLCIMINGRSVYFTPYLFYQDSYICNSSVQNCHQYVCSLDPSQRAQYVNPQFSSLITKFDDNRCELFSTADKIQFIIYIGGIAFGIILGILVAAMTTKRRLIMICIFLSIVSLTLTALFQTLQLITIALFINYGMQTAVMPMYSSYFMETVQQQFRAKSSLIIFVSFCVGIVFNGIIFKYVDWKINILLFCVLPSIFCLVMFRFYLKETPFDLLINYQAEQCYSQLKFIADQNGVNIDQKQLKKEITNIKDDYEQDIKKNHQNTNISVFDLFRYPSIRKITLFCSASFFFLGLQYDGSTLFLSNYSIDIYLSSIVLGLSSLIISLISYSFINELERKKIMYVAQIIGIISCMIMALFGHCTQGQQCSGTTQIVQAICLFVYRMSCSLYMTIFCIYVGQLLPNQVRILGIQLIGICYSVSVVFVPAISGWFKSMNLSLGYGFAILCLLAIPLLIPLKETFQIPPEQMIQELKFGQKKIQAD